MPAAAEAVEPAAVGRRARFDPKIRIYLFWSGASVMLMTVVGIAALPFWLLGAGQWWSRRYYESLVCELGERHLEFGKGRFFRVEKTIPLDTIQDLTLKEGPLLRAFGLCSLRIETAGQSGPQGSGEAELVGIVDPRRFRAAVLAQRDLVLQQLEPRPTAAAGDTVGEIRDILRRIEARLERSGGGRPVS